MNILLNRNHGTNQQWSDLFALLKVRYKQEIIQDDSGGICNTLGNDSMCYSK